MKPVIRKDEQFKFSTEKLAQMDEPEPQEISGKNRPKKGKEAVKAEFYQRSKLTQKLGENFSETIMSPVIRKDEQFKFSTGNLSHFDESMPEHKKNEFLAINLEKMPEENQQEINITKDDSSLPLNGNFQLEKSILCEKKVNSRISNINKYDESSITHTVPELSTPTSLMQNLQFDKYTRISLGYSPSDESPMMILPLPPIDAPVGHINEHEKNIPNFILDSIKSSPTNPGTTDNTFTAK